MMTLFDKQIEVRMGQANVGAGSPTSCRCSTTTTRSGSTGSRPTTCRSQAPEAYKDFQKKRRRHQDGPAAVTRHRPRRVRARGRLTHPMCQASTSTLPAATGTGGTDGFSSTSISSGGASRTRNFPATSP